MPAHHLTDGEEPEAEEGPVIVVRVVRTGGIAGLRREWIAQPPPVDAPRWIDLVHGCPWPDAASDLLSEGADRFRWRISALLSDEPPREAEMPDERLTGPWRDLVDEVRSFARPVAAPDR